jgi:aspartyl-tRNA synthetase
LTLAAAWYFSAGHSARESGHLIFIDLRDRTGIVQLAFDGDTDPEIFEKAKTVRSEDVLAVRGYIRRRESVNNEIPTGQIEVIVIELRILQGRRLPR